ncbi:ABC-type sugar transporter%2C permease protein [Mycobacterium tuberculosis]|nr:ABC-type sugar transporter%2C permease protein [Mycobacterium tuberculosis]
MDEAVTAQHAQPTQADVPDATGIPGGTGPRTRRTARHRPSLGDILGRWGLLLAFGATLLAFALTSPDTFFTADNMRSVLLQSSAPMILAVGLTILLVLGDFDLSIGSMLGLGGASAVAMMALHHTPWQLALAIGLGLAVIVGLANGVIVAYFGASSFITTLAMGTVLVGVEFAFTDQKTIYEGVADAYLSLGQSAPFGGVNVQVWIAAGVAVLVWLLLEHTEIGRFFHAIGGNPDAAYFSGIAVRRWRVLGFVLVAVAAALAGILVTAQAGSSAPQAGLPYLLPAYAAAFLGSTSLRPGQFNVAGTVIATVFLQVIQTGLQMLQLSTAYINVVQGAILIVAMLLSRLGQGRA